jgi:hypothetical protein
MWALVTKALLSGALIAAISEIGKRLPVMAALVASLPLVSILGMIFLWREKPDAENLAIHSEATFWYVLPSLPMFLLMPVALRAGLGFWTALALGCCVTIALYGLMMVLGPRFGLRL